MSTGAAPSRPRGPRRLLPSRATATPPSASRPSTPDDVATVVDHLTELRTRVIIVFAWFVLAFALCWWQLDAIFRLLDRPLDDQWPLQTLGVTEPFFMSLSVAAQSALLLALPVLAWNAWRYVRPAIAPEARRAIALLLVAAPLLFGFGVAFGYLVVLGPAVHFLLGMAPGSIDVVVRANEYYSFVTTTLMAIGLAFCFPLLLLGLARVGIVDAARLRSSRRFAYVLMVVLAALLPTADPVSLALEILPLVALYELSIVGVRIQARLVERSAARAAAAADADAEPAA